MSFSYSRLTSGTINATVLFTSPHYCIYQSRLGLYFYDAHLGCNRLLLRGFLFSLRLARALRIDSHVFTSCDYSLIAIRIRKKLFVYRYCQETSNLTGPKVIDLPYPFLVPALKDNKLIFGEYQSNPSRGPVSVSCLDLLSGSIEDVIRLDNVRHIHSVFWIKSLNSFILLSGDTDSESKIIFCRSDFFVYRSFSVGQMTRCIHALELNERILFFQDSEYGINNIYRFNPEDGSYCSILAFPNPIFHVVRQDMNVFLSTNVEPCSLSSTASAYKILFNQNAEIVSIRHIYSHSTLLKSLLKYTSYCVIRLNWLPGHGLLVSPCFPDLSSTTFLFTE